MYDDVTTRLPTNDTNDIPIYEDVILNYENFILTCEIFIPTNDEDIKSEHTYNVCRIQVTSQLYHQIYVYI